MSTNFSGYVLPFKERIKWTLSVLSFLGSLIPSFFIKQSPWNILLPAFTILFPFFVEFFYRIFKAYYFKCKLKFILEKKSYKIKARGMFIDSSFKTKSNDWNKEIQLSKEYISKISIEYNFWSTNLKLIFENSIKNKSSSISFSYWVDVIFESKNLIKISFFYNNKFIDNKHHKSKSLNNFSGVCNLVFNKGKIDDYFYSSDGKNRFSFLKEWEEID